MKKTLLLQEYEEKLPLVSKTAAAPTFFPLFIAVDYIFIAIFSNFFQDSAGVAFPIFSKGLPNLQVFKVLSSTFIDFFSVYVNIFTNY